MKWLFLFVLTAAVSVALAQPLKKLRHYRTVKTFVFDLNNDGRNDTIILSSDTDGNYFDRITISITGYRKQTFRAKQLWTTVDKEFLDSNKNEVSSNLLFIKKTEKHAVILLFGESSGSGYRAEFTIINVENNLARKVFDHDDDRINVERALKLDDLEHDGRLCFIYRNLYELCGAVGDADVGSYSPYYVYRVDDSCQLNKPLTKAYNEKHYVFAGYTYSEKKLIIYPRHKGKPRVVRNRKHISGCPII